MEFEELAAREMPHSVEAEQSVLGALLMDWELLPLTMEYLKPESFYVSKHRELYSIMLRLFMLGEKADLITVLNQAVQEGVFENSGAGKEYLAGIANELATVTNTEGHCKIIAEKYYLRSMIEAAKQMISMCTEASEPASVILDSAEQMIYDIRQGRDIGGLTRVDEVLLDAYDNLNRISGPDKEKYIGARSGYSGLDNIISGLNKSDLLILAARPGMGKSAFALNIAAKVAYRNRDKEIAYFSLEMSKEQLVTRMLAAESFVPLEHLVKGNVDPDDWEKLAEGANRIAAMNLYLDDAVNITVMQIKAKLRRMKNLGLVVIDYLQLMSSGKRIENKVNEVSEITRQLKLMAKELNVPVITLSQLSRSVESRPDKRPLLSDLRDSGSIEQDADIVMFLYREGYYNRDKVEDVNLSECIVAKNRHGETGTVKLRWNGQYTLFISEENRPMASPQGS